jgi:hypothetical protein
MSFEHDDTQQNTETSNAYGAGRPRRRKLAPMMLAFLLVAGGGFAAYRFFGPGDGPGPQTASAGAQLPAPPRVQPQPEPTEPWVNPAFKGLSSKETTILRAKIAGAAVGEFMAAGDHVGEFSQWLESLPVAVKKPTKAELARAADRAAAEAAKAAKAVLDAAKPRPIALAPGVEPGSFRVSGIMSSGSGSMAVINGGVYRVGQKVSGAVVQSIDPKRVVLIINDQKFWVGM